MPRRNRKLIRWGVLLLGVAFMGFGLWNYVTGWAPSRNSYPVQGIIANESNGQPQWSELGATGVDFAYITAVEGARGRDPQFQANLAAVQEADLSPYFYHLQRCHQCLRGGPAMAPSTRPSGGDAGG